MTVKEMGPVRASSPASFFWLRRCLTYGQAKSRGERMVKQTSLFVVVILICLAAFVATERGFSLSFQDCISGVKKRGIQGLVSSGFMSAALAGSIQT